MSSLMISSQNILEVDKINKQYHLLSKGLKAENNQNILYVLKDISFNLPMGESLGIIGRNGSGKSTLLKILSGITKPNSGTVTIFGTHASILDLGFGMVPDFTGRENIYFIGSLDGHTRGGLHKYIDEIIDFSELATAIDQPVKTYSNGMYLRLAFAIKTILQTDLLILDELLSVGDLKFQEKCRLKIKQMQLAGKSIIIVSHNLKEIAEYTHNCLMLENGNIVAEGRTMDVIHKYETLMNGTEYKVSPTVNYGIDKGELVKVIDYTISNHKVSILNQKITTSIQFEIRKPARYDVMFYLSDFNGLIICDSFSYRENIEYKVERNGVYTCECEIPANFLNEGTFYIGYAITDGHVSLFKNLRCMKLEVLLEKNLVITPWDSQNESFPLKPQLKWSVELNKNSQL